MYLTLLERGRIEKHEHYLHVLKHETERLTRLIQDLLDLSRLETAGPPNLAAVTDTSPLLRAYYDYYSEQARHKNIRCSYKIPHSLPILIEERHFEQLMTNLLGNALAYTPPAGEIALQAAVADQDICLRVSNSGPGIIPEDLPHLFDRFYRGHIAQEMTIPGTGLGLAICQEIVERYNGRIEVHSKPYQLTTFTIWLPLASDTETKMPNPNIGSAFATRIQ
jgi:two-component system phosphate regulon sensor histidine kinase PhoR